ncbi:unnamed protein product, partial [Closterium sp. NIES-65]
CWRGEAVRKAAMVTAGRSFTHDIQTEKWREDRLVTHGLYRWVWHPGYTGWFIHPMNHPVDVSYPVGSDGLGQDLRCRGYEEFYLHQFFGLDYEEFYLHQIFGLEYARYAASVMSGIPFVS